MTVYSCECNNTGEKPIKFYLPGYQTVYTAGVNTITFRTAGHEKMQFIVVLACQADGMKHKQMVIFNKRA